MLILKFINFTTPTNTVEKLIKLKIMDIDDNKPIFSQRVYKTVLTETDTNNQICLLVGNEIKHENLNCSLNISVTDNDQSLQYNFINLYVEQLNKDIKINQFFQIIPNNGFKNLNSILFYSNSDFDLKSLPVNENEKISYKVSI